MQNNKSKLSVIIIALVWFLPSMALAQLLEPNLRELIHQGLDKSHSVNSYNFDKEQAKVDQKIAKSVLLPKLTLNGSYTRLNDDITFDEDTENLLISTQKLLIKEAVGIPFNDAFPESIPLTAVPNLQNKNILKSNMDLDWVVFSGFAVDNAIEASKHKEASLNHLTEVEKGKVALKIIETYDKLALVYASKGVLTTSQDFLNEQEYFVRKAIENGLTTPIDRKKIELAQQQLEGKLLEFEQNKTLLIEVLHQLTNDDREHLSSLQPTLEPYAINTLSMAEKRNEIMALEEAEQATLFKAQMEKNNFIPKVAVKGHYEFIESGLSLLDPKWYVGLGLKWNVFDGFESRLKSEKTKIEGLKYGEQKAEAEEMIALSIINAEFTYQSSLQNIKMVHKEIELASDTYDMINKQYKNSLASVNDVLDALNELEKSNFKLQESFFKQRKAATALLHAKGILYY
ncbi:TolC family protein [Arcticibacterium luteifluviistationis]|uniref:TolC family protein n=1 Tax=Arcticibacterium luteifluviistationis TaxID=1784714 RepID=A0A2Z4G7H8_9BACT|nr:TolC family protein [Arcticibacterium luteifluviistationis]AWV97109.1 TolC family protein [Arcticibacterium luteifluviistationis]